MKICVVGAGAIGGFMGARLAHSGCEVSLIARGAHLAAIRRNGLKLIQDGEVIVAKNLTATDDLSGPGIQDIVLLALKAHQISAVVEKLPDLIGANTVMVTLQNGIPWWYFQKLPGQKLPGQKLPGQKLPKKYHNRPVETTDPGGVLAGAINPDCLIGCVAYPAAAIAEPGVIRHIEGIRFPIGELDGTISERVQKVSEVFTKAGFKSPTLDDIRSEIWLKLWGNLTFNPISALTHATLEAICRFPPSRALAGTMMREAQEVAEKLGATFRVGIERRIDGAEKVGKHKTSMLQDVEAGKPLEIDGMLGAVIELAEVTETHVPALRAVHACACLLNQKIETEKVAIVETAAG